MVATRATHYNIHGPYDPIATYDLGIVIVPKNNPQVDMDRIRAVCDKVTIMQEGPSTFWQDYSVPNQIHFFNTLTEADFLLCHNKQDQLYYNGLTGKDTFVMKSLMIPDAIMTTSPREPTNSVMLGGNWTSWYSGVDSYILGQVFTPEYELYAPSMGRKKEEENEIEDVNYFDYMMWQEWIDSIKNMKVGIHMMRIFAAGTFALNCSYWGIPCIGYKGLDTQETCHPLTSVDLGDMEKARHIAEKLKNDKGFYDLCSMATLKRYEKHYSEAAWLKDWKSIEEYTNG